jgi:anti-sigma factor RsiW
MKCPRAHELIHAYLDGVISPPDRHALDDHLAGCEACRRELAATRGLLGLLAETPRRPLSGDFDRTLQARLAELGPRRSLWPVWGRPWPMNAWRALSALVPLAAVVAAVTAYQTLAPLAPPADPPALDSAVYVAQCVRQHEAAARGPALTEAAMAYNVQVTSAASIADDLLQ